MRLMLAIAAGSLAWLGTAHAGCGPENLGSPQFGAPQEQSPEGRFIHTAFTENDEDQAPASIVGLWSFKFYAKGNKGIPDGTVIDAGYVTWHADGTELMNSGRAPMTQSFCMGVWKQIGRSSFRLNHVALSWDPTGSVFVGPASIREETTVEPDGNHYYGWFLLTQYSTDKKTILARVGGLIKATRVNVD